MVEAYVTDPQGIQNIVEFLNGTRGMPNAPRLCPEHGKAVEIRIEGANLDNPSQTNIRAVITGCCKAAIDNEVDAISKTLGWVDYLKKSQGK